MRTISRVGGQAVVGGFILWTLLSSVPVLASVGETPAPVLALRQDSLPKVRFIRDYQVALSRYNAGHRAQAVSMWKALAEKGDPESQYTLGVLYSHGNGGLGQDLIACVHWYGRAAEQGHMNAQYNLGILYATGKGLVPDPATAIRWWRLAAIQGHVEAQFNLGLFYSEGNGVSPDPVEAVKWWRLAADQGMAEAQFNLGLMYMMGEGIGVNPHEALRLWRLSANQGLSQAITILKTLDLDP